MRAALSFGKILGAVAIAALLSASPAMARINDYSTDMGEPDIMTVKNEHCCGNTRLKQDANVEINVTHAFLPSVKKIKIHILDAGAQEVAAFSTKDRIIYMHLPEGNYTVKVDAILDHTQVKVDASDSVLKKFTV